MKLPEPQLKKHYQRTLQNKLVGIACKSFGAKLAYSNYRKLESVFTKTRAFDFTRARLGYSDKTLQKLTVLRAATTRMWPMGTHYCVRDNALVGKRLIGICLHDSTFSGKLRRLGKQVLLSGLTIMSTSSQCARFRAVIESTSETFCSDAASWPQIFLGITDNLSGERHEPWAHKQDAWQILAHSVLQCLESGKITENNLNPENREFFSLVAPFLARVRFYNQPNSGSWEELEAVRTSVIAWDMALLDQIYRMSAGKRFAFLESGFKKYQSTLTEYACTTSFTAFLQDLLTRGAQHLKKTIPFECPQYPRSDARHRLADAALIYLLQLDTPRLVAEMLDLPESWVEESETKLLKTISSLYDPRTGGHRRYQNDSYQRFGFFRNLTARKLTEMYGAPSGDASAHFVGRDRVVPKGPEAAWTHFTWQLSAWAGRRYQETLNLKYFKLQQRYFSEGLRTISPKALHSVEQAPDGSMRVIKLPAYRFPECYLTEEDSKGRQFVFPSPHTPLNWATAEALSAFSMMYANLR